ncbi:MAG: AAA family ATPase [Deltaproteobacteria bacterium]|jgi:DNA helicase-2/ATP-dependent DNA helicase PcrA|nr:AAA family ATPase [Deltaproteobacteria bacterium]MBW2530764.1 AAA family ATPase [Deltaproteobacteria bacterium]
MSRSTNVTSNRRRSKPPRRRKPAEEDGLAIAREEEQLCGRVVAHLATLRPSKPPPRWDDDEALLSLRDQIATAHVEDIPALMAQMERVQAVANQRARKVVEPIDPTSPYFGHLRLDETQRGTRDILIGKVTYLEPRQDIRIVDWRHAPISQLYYRYDEGARYEETFGDRDVEGKVLVRRTVTIEGGQLERISAPQGVFFRNPDGSWKRSELAAAELAGGEGSALRAEHVVATTAKQALADQKAHQRPRGVLGGGPTATQREDRHLPEIAALLDSRQFELISGPDTGLIVIKGGAGSGKTTIGVHRLAFLSYQDPQRFAADKMLVVVGTPALRAYISQLLEALDVAAIRVVTWSEWARKARRRHFPWLNLPIEDNTPADVTRLKTDPAVLRLLEARAAKLGDDQTRDPRLALWLWAEVLTDRDGLREAFDARDPSRDGPGLTPEQLERAWRYCSDRCPAVVDYNPDEEDEDEDDTAYGADGQNEQRDDRARLDPEDDALLLRAVQLVCNPVQGRRGPVRLEHLFVDEAQDLAAAELAVLADLVSDKKSITLAGDTDQRIELDRGFSDWEPLLADLSLEHVAVEPLRIAYRSTRQVLAFARAVLGPLAEPDPPLAPRSGAPVEHHHFPSPGAAAAFLADALRPLANREPRASIAILTRYPEQADAYYEALEMAEVPRLSRVKNFDFSFRPGVEVTEIRQVKGLEYDYVILVDVNASSFPVADDARYQLHIGATRAAHQLWVISTGTPSPLIPDWLRR